jgi:hypothetical protein
LPNDRLTIFVHLHKTGGTTLRRILSREYGRDEFLDLDFVRGEDELASYRASADQRERVRAIAGHLAFGLADELDRPANYVTLVREPVARVLSYFHYLQAHPEAPEQYRRTTLEEFIADPDVEADVHNEQTRLLGSQRGAERAAPTRATLEQAKQHIQRHVVVAGTTERFDESVLLMAQKLEWQSPPYYVRRNVGSGERPELSPELRAAIVEHNTLDVELHRWVSARLDATIGREGLRFRAHAARFRALNSHSGHRARAAVQWVRSRFDFQETKGGNTDR